MIKFKLAVFVLMNCLMNIVISAPIGNLYVHPVDGGTQVPSVSGHILELMDDFIVPEGQTWSITSVISEGFIALSTDVEINFYTNSSGSTSACYRLATNINNGPMEFDFPSTCTLTSGTYWYAVKTLSSNDLLIHNGTYLISGEQSRIRDSFGSFCGDNFVPYSDCLSSTIDLNFTIRGCMGAVCDTPSVILLESGGSTDVDEAEITTTDSYTLVLNAIPALGEVVTITPTSDIIKGVTVSPNNAVFDTTDWDTPVIMTVSAIDDVLPETSPHTSTITHITTSNNAYYDGLLVDSIIVNILDDNDEIIFTNGFE